MVINQTNSNTDALANAVDSLKFNNIDQLQQGASVLFSITSQAVGSNALTNTLDMKGRNEAASLIQKMANSFQSINVPDPNMLVPFLQSITGSVSSVLQVSQNCLCWSSVSKTINLAKRSFKILRLSVQSTAMPEIFQLWISKKLTGHPQSG